MSIHGLCDLEQPHTEHVDYDQFPTGWFCPGQASDCRNCDDRKCMDCVLRVWHDECEDSCPMCCDD